MAARALNILIVFSIFIPFVSDAQNPAKVPVWTVSDPSTNQWGSCRDECLKEAAGRLQDICKRYYGYDLLLDLENAPRRALARKYWRGDLVVFGYCGANQK